MRHSIKVFPLILIASTFALFGCNKKDEGYVKVDSIESFFEALNKKNEKIEVADLDLNEQIVTLNYSVSIKGKDKQSQIKNAYFQVVGPNTIGESINVRLSNIIFDGGINSIDYDLTQEKSFTEIFGSTRETKRCINADFGYYNLSLDNCVIKNYCSEVGSAIFFENNLHEDSRYVSLNNCKIHNNISAQDTIHFSNNKADVKISNSEFYDNYAYKAAGFSVANGTCNIDFVNVHDNHFIPLDINKDNFQMCGGGIYIGGANAKISNSFITNNETIWGGGIGVSSNFSGDNNIVFNNVSIKQNKAVNGGGICAFSLSGQPISFIDCEVLANSATKGGPLYVETYAKFNKKNNGGIVEFYFSSFGMNSALDTNSFGFYDVEHTKGQIGKIILKGCVYIGNDTYENNEENYNYISTKENALIDGVVSEDTLTNISTKGLVIEKGSKADKVVSKDTFKNWSNLLNDYSDKLTIGNIAKGSNSKNNTVIYVVLVAGVFVILGLLLTTVFIIKKSRKTGVFKVKTEKIIDDPRERLASLTDREYQEVKMMVELKKRKEIAEELNYSENTIKKDLTSIYLKLGVTDKYQLISKYKDFL